MLLPNIHDTKALYFYSERGTAELDGIVQFLELNMEPSLLHTDPQISAAGSCKSWSSNQLG